MALARVVFPEDGIPHIASRNCSIESQNVLCATAKECAAKKEVRAVGGIESHHYGLIVIFKLLARSLYLFLTVTSVTFDASAISLCVRLSSVMIPAI